MFDKREECEKQDGSTSTKHSGQCGGEGGLNILKEFRGENWVYGYPCDPPPPKPSINNEEEVIEIRNLAPSTLKSTRGRDDEIRRAIRINPEDLTHWRKGKLSAVFDVRGQTPLYPPLWRI